MATPVARFNMAEIIWTLRQTQRQFKKINKTLNVRHTPFTNEMVSNMIVGYRFVDRLLAQGIDLFAIGNSRLFFEINTLILCGTDAKKRENFSAHIAQNEKYFYDNEGGGIGALMEWNEFHAGDNIWKKAAGLYIHIMSQPQLFIEGNHRSAILLVSFLLAREGHPPFVLSPSNAKELLDQSKQLSELKKHGLRTLILLPRLRNHLARTLRNTLEVRHRLDTPEQADSSALNAAACESRHPVESFRR